MSKTQSWWWLVSMPWQDVAGLWRVSVHGLDDVLHGPYDIEADALAARWALARRWVLRAQRRGGCCQCHTRELWRVTLPEGAEPPTGGIPWTVRLEAYTRRPYSTWDQLMEALGRIREDVDISS